MTLILDKENVPKPNSVTESDNFAVQDHAINESGLEFRENFRHIKEHFVTHF